MLYILFRSLRQFHTGPRILPPFSRCLMYPLDEHGQPPSDAGLGYHFLLLQTVLQQITSSHVFFHISYGILN